MLNFTEVMVRISWDSGQPTLFAFFHPVLHIYWEGRGSLFSLSVHLSTSSGSKPPHLLQFNLFMT